MSRIHLTHLALSFMTKDLSQKKAKMSEISSSSTNYTYSHTRPVGACGELLIQPLSSPASIPPSTAIRHSSRQPSKRSCRYKSQIT